MQRNSICGNVVLVRDILVSDSKLLKEPEFDNEEMRGNYHRPTIQIGKIGKPNVLLY